MSNEKHANKTETAGARARRIWEYGAMSSYEDQMAELQRRVRELEGILREIVAACDRCSEDDDKNLIDYFSQDTEDRARAVLNSTKEKS